MKINCRELMKVVSHYSGRKFNNSECSKNLYNQCASNECKLLLSAVKDLLYMSKNIMEQPMPQITSDKLHNYLRTKINNEQISG